VNLIQQWGIEYQRNEDFTYMAKKIKILFLAANPVDTKYHLQLDREFSQIREKLRTSKKGDSFKLMAEWLVTPDNLQDCLLKHKPHILHFSGHGSETNGMALEDRMRNIFLLDKGAFAELLKIIKDNIRIVVLNACYTTDQANALTETIDFTVGMNKPIGDRAASVFAAYFYQGLAYGRSVQEAFRLATNQIKVFKIPESDTPKLLVRPGVDPNEHILINKQPENKEERKGHESHPDASPASGDTADVIFKNDRSKIRGGQVGIKK
jgi:CHAT domain